MDEDIMQMQDDLEDADDLDLNELDLDD